MKNLRFKMIFLGFVLIGLGFGLKARAAEDLYVAQNAAGAGTGSSCSAAKAVSWFNSSDAWSSGTGVIGAGDTVHLCGTITSSLDIFGNGSAGSLITILWEAGAKLSQPAASLFVNVAGNSYVTFDGGINGIIENTANGTGSGQQATKVFDISGSNNITIKKLNIRTIYVHAINSDATPDITMGGAVYLNGSASYININNNVFSDIGWVLNFQCGGNTCTNFSVSDNSFVDFDHGLASGQSSGGTFNNVSIFGNHFGSTVKWDTASNIWHHDGLHLYINSGTPTATGWLIYNNLFDGDWGTEHATSMVYVEHTGISSKWFNNVFIEKPGNFITNGLFNLTDLASGSEVYNNTVYGSGTDQNFTCMSIGGTNLKVKNNVIANCAALIYGSNAPTFASGGFDYNVYRVSNSAQAFDWKGTFYSNSNFAGWKAVSGEGSHSSFAETSAGIDSLTGIPSAGSAVIDAGADLSAVGITGIVTDRVGVSRPQGSAWDAGAYEYGSGGSVNTAPAAPTGLIVN